MRKYRKVGTQEMYPWTPKQDMDHVSVSPEDTPEVGGMIAVNKDNTMDRWYVAKKFFEDNYEEVGA